MFIIFKQFSTVFVYLSLVVDRLLTPLVIFPTKIPANNQNCNNKSYQTHLRNSISSVRSIVCFDRRNFRRIFSDVSSHDSKNSCFKIKVCVCVIQRWCVSLLFQSGLCVPKAVCCSESGIYVSLLI